MFLALSQDEIRGSPDKYKSYVTTYLFLDDLNQWRGKNICFQDCNFPDDTILLHGAIPWERAFLWLLNWKSCRNAISGIYLLWSQAHMETRQTDQIQFVVLRYSESPCHRALLQYMKCWVKLKNYQWRSNLKAMIWSDRLLWYEFIPSSCKNTIFIIQLFCLHWCLYNNSWWWTRFWYEVGVKVECTL